MVCNGTQMMGGKIAADFIMNHTKHLNSPSASILIILKICVPSINVL